MGRRRKKVNRPDAGLAIPDENDARYPITGASPPAYMVRFVGGLSDYDPDERHQTVGVMRNVALGVLVVCVLLIGLGFLLL
jgi:hypothetical protein